MLVVSGSRDGILTAESPLHRSLLAQGIAVLTLGKKGVSPSTGNWENETFYNRASNVVAALDWLNTRNDVNGQEVVIYAHSQGAYVTPLMADDPRVQALVLAAAPAEIVRQQIYTDKVESDTRKGKSAIRATTAAKRQQRFLDMLTHVCPVYKVHYLCHIYNFDPKPALEKLTKPVLVLYAGNDPMVPHHKNLPLMQAFLKHNNKAQFTVIPGGNHMFWHSTTGLPEEYISLRGPVATFPFADPNNLEHERLANLFANRVKQSPGYQEAVEDFVKRIFENQLSKMAESNSL
ncbi:hypothetical protein GCM10010919_29030 [Alishewanella longhuensis]|uniref:AB hydrolase-1 domain-containing protein n=2 Tax=Alishewanella longhuensis TaxID=1091037 RepID=A0ABQ3L264_9ALTE|nr:hypothetical protein GCM10010919_29030 [Alishewanella longhuensis]